MIRFILVPGVEEGWSIPPATSPSSLYVLMTGVQFIWRLNQIEDDYGHVINYPSNGEFGPGDFSRLKKLAHRLVMEAQTQEPHVFR